MSGFRFQSNAPAGIGGKLLLSLFFCFFLGMGSLFVWLVTREAAAAIQTWTWKQTPCAIVSSSVNDNARNGDFRLAVNYRYSFGGHDFVSEKYKRRSTSFSDYGQAARLAQRYGAGSSAVCYVNPAAPAQAVLERDSPFMVLLIFFPLIFVAIGVGGIYFVWRSKPLVRESARPVSDLAVTNRGQWLLVAFFSIFLLAGSGFFYGFFLRPVFKIVAARNWPAVPCTVISSEVVTHRGNKGSTYSVNILYRYTFNEREFKANRYDFMGGSSSGYSGKVAIVSRHPPGTKTLCYVNPSEPTEAVLERGFTPVMWFGLMPLLFVAVGAGGLMVAIRKRRQAALPSGTLAQGISFDRSSGRSMPALMPSTASEPVLLKPKMSPAKNFFALLFIALFWNGIVSVFVTQGIQGWRSHRPEWFLLVFMIPFVLIGLLLVGGVVYSFLALFNPRPHLRLTPGAVPLGGELRVEWEISGRTEVLQKLQLRLQGREEASYRSGKSTATDTSVFADIPVAEVTAQPEMRSGSGTAKIPADLMHSFAAANNKIVWSIRLRGEIARWPDINEEFPLTVLPAARTERNEDL